MTMKELLEKARRLGVQPWQIEMMQAVDDSHVRDLVNDFSRGPAAPSSLTETPGVAPRTSGPAVEVPLAPPPGVTLVDALCDAQDAVDRAELKRKLGK
jgi:hypothetical protein